ncbi:hypothetical protein AY600_13570 [Phormidium willei BDU 130791]|nr:hypothetical protein AY600_13570 [Phormidium willei BDU 130791]
MRITFLLFDGFSNIVLGCLLEPLRAVRDASDRPVEWAILTPDDAPVHSSSDLRISPTAPVDTVSGCDLLVAVAGYGFRSQVDPPTLQLLHRLTRTAEQVVAADTAAWLVAAAGLLREQEATIHWQVLAEFAETFPEVSVVPTRYVKQGRIWTCGGASTALDLALSFIKDSFGPAVAFDASSLFLHDAERQRKFGRGPNHLQSRGSAKLHSLVNMMVDTIEAPVPLDQLAARANLSLRTLHRLFVKEIGMTPGRYYQLLRLSRARDLATSTELDLREIALRSGFADASSLGKAFKAAFGASLSKTRFSR